MIHSLSLKLKNTYVPLQSRNHEGSRNVGFAPILLCFLRGVILGTGFFWEPQDLASHAFMNGGGKTELAGLEFQSIAFRSIGLPIGNMGSLWL